MERDTGARCPNRHADAGRVVRDVNSPTRQRIIVLLLQPAQLDNTNAV